MNRIATTPAPQLSQSSLKRWTLAVAGVCCVGLGGVGAFVPGLPTTVFLLAACWCFARSCPWMENVLIRNRFFRPFLAYLDPGAVMPRRAKGIAIVTMWIAISASAVMFAMRGDAIATPAIATLVVAGAAGTWAILRWRGAAGARACAATNPE